MIIADGVARSLYELPKDRAHPGKFSLLDSSYDNSGNAIHAEVPFSLWDTGKGEVIDARQMRVRTGADLERAIRFANENASHYVLSAANFLLFEDMSDQRRQAYEEMQKSLEKLTIPLVVLGIGVQAPRRWNPIDHKLPKEAVQLMSFLGHKCELISVRGEFTASVFRDYAGVRNTIVTGCPSFFQNPRAFSNLREFLASKRKGNVSYNMTNYRKPAEQELMARAIHSDNFWIGVTKDELYRFFLESNQNFELASVPESLRFLFDQMKHPITRDHLAKYYTRRYRHYSDAHSWNEFNKEQIRFSYGTRFHANMSVLNSGKPALWIVHDSRTQEMVDALNLPHVTLTEAVENDLNDLEESLNYEELFDGLVEKYQIFNRFLKVNDLPMVDFTF